MKILLSKSQWEYIGQQAGWIEKQAVIFENPSDRIQKGRALVEKGPDSYLESLKARMSSGESSVSPVHESMIVLKNLHRMIEILKELLGEKEWASSPKAREWDKKAEELSKAQLQRV